MTITICSINASFSHTSYSAYSLRRIIENDYKYTMHEFTINNETDTIIKGLYDDNSDIYLFSCYLWNIEKVLQIIDVLKQIKECSIILGGSEVGYCPELFFSKSDAIDFIVAYDAEETLPELLLHIKDKISYKFPENAYIKVKQFTPKVSYNNLNFSDRVFAYNEDDLINFENKIIYYESSRGCPFDCSYCISHLDRAVREIPLEKVKEELLFFIKNEISLVKFIDRTFNYNSKRAEKIIEFILENNINSCFHFEVKLETLSDRCIELIRSAPKDWFQLEIGLQSTNEPTLKEIHRKNIYEIFSRKMDLLHEKENVQLHLDLIALLPYETLQTFIEGFNYVYNLKPHMFQLGFLKVLRGTQMEANATKYGLKYRQYPPYEALQTNTMSYEDSLHLKDICYIVDKYYNSMSFKNTLDTLVSKFDTPYELYYDFVAHLKTTDFFSRSLSKKELYKFMFIYLESKGNIEIIYKLAYDYLSNVDLSLPNYFNDFATIMTKEEKNAILTDDFVLQRQYLFGKDYKIQKFASFYKFAHNPVDAQTENNIFMFAPLKDKTLYIEAIR